MSSQLSIQELELVTATLYGHKIGLAHFVCGDLDDCNLQVYADSNTLPGDDIDLVTNLLKIPIELKSNTVTIFIFLAS